MRIEQLSSSTIGIGSYSFLSGQSLHIASVKLDNIDVITNCLPKTSNASVKYYPKRNIVNKLSLSINKHL